MSRVTLLVLAALVAHPLGAQQLPAEADWDTRRFGYRGLVLGETTIAQAEKVLAEPIACNLVRRTPPPPQPVVEITCSSPNGLASPQQPILVFLDGVLRGASFLMPHDRTIEIVSAQVATIFPGPGQSFRLADGSRLWRSRPDAPAVASVYELSMRAGDPERIVVVMTDKRVPWPTDD